MTPVLAYLAHLLWFAEIEPCDGMTAGASNDGLDQFSTGSGDDT